MEKYVGQPKIHSIKEVNNRKRKINKALYDIHNEISNEIKSFSSHHFIGSMINDESVGTISKFAFLAYNAKKILKWVKHFKKPKKQK